MPVGVADDEPMNEDDEERERLNPSRYITCRTRSGHVDRRRAAAGGRQRVAELSQLGHAMPADPARGPEAGSHQRARLG